MIRILHIIATLDPAGAERQMVHLCRRLDRTRFRPGVCCLTRGGPLESDLAEADVPVSILHKRGRYDVTVLSRLKRAIRDFRPDIVHTWLPTANTLGRIAASLAGVKVRIASERAADVWKGSLRRWIDRRLAPGTMQILCNANAIRQFLVERIGLHGDEITVIHNGLDIEAFDRAADTGPTAPLPERPPGLLLGTVARLEPQKGLTYLIQAMAELEDTLPDARLWIAGDGPERENLEQQIHESGLAGRVVLLGRRDDVPALMRRFDLFVLPSLWEGLPNVALEAMTAGRAVVATDVNGTPEAVADGETGLLVPAQSPIALSKAIRDLADDAQRRARMGTAGRARVEEYFSMEQMVDAHQDVYEWAMRKDDA